MPLTLIIKNIINYTNYQISKDETYHPFFLPFYSLYNLNPEPFGFINCHLHAINNVIKNIINYINY